jgi:hypothetical protein
VLRVHGALDAVQLADELNTDPVAAPVLRLDDRCFPVADEYDVDPTIARPRPPTSCTR